MKISIQKFNILFGVIVAFVMSSVLSSIMITVNVGIDKPYYFQALLGGMVVSFLISLPLAIVVIPFIRLKMEDLFEIDYSQGPPFSDVRFAKQYDRIAKTVFGRLNDEFARRMQSELDEGVILDVGCGTGVLACKLAKGNCRVFGIDASESMLTIATRNRQEEQVACDFRKAPADAIPFDDEYFDMVVSNGSLHDWENPVGALQEMHRVLKPGGRALINDLNKDFDRGEMQKLANGTAFKPMREGFLNNVHKGTYDKGTLEGLLKQTSFKKTLIEAGSIFLEVELQK